MNRIVVDASLHELLPQLPVSVQLVDAAGNVLGVFTPDPAVVAAWEAEVPEEELQRREAEPGGRTLAEIMADLEKRG